MQTIARPVESEASHWYDPKTAEPKHSVERSDGQGQRPTTLRDARKFGWVPSTTNVLRVLDKPALNAWKTEMACLTVLTAPRLEGEQLDAFVHRVLHEEKQQEQEGAKARNLGTDIHAAAELALKGQPYDTALSVYVEPAIAEILRTGRVVATEKIVVGDRYAGKLDCMTQGNDLLTLWDIKSAKTLPKTESYWEHQCQTASYAKAVENPGRLRIQTANVYVSTIEPGTIKVCAQIEWERAWQAFKALVAYWYLANDL